MHRPWSFGIYVQCFNLPSDVDNCGRNLTILYAFPLVSHRLAALWNLCARWDIDAICQRKLPLRLLWYFFKYVIIWLNDIYWPWEVLSQRGWYQNVFQASLNSTTIGSLVISSHTRSVTRMCDVLWWLESIVNFLQWHGINWTLSTSCGYLSAKDPWKKDWHSTVRTGHGLFFDDSKSYSLTAMINYGLVTIYGDMNLGQHWTKKWLIA